MYKYGNKSSTSKVSKRFVKRTARRIPRAIRTTGMSMKAEFDDVVYYANGTNLAIFGYNNLTYHNFFTILSQNNAFVSQCSNFTKYKITGVSVVFTPVFNETNIAAAWTHFGSPILYCQQYPTATSASVGDAAQFSDNNLMVKPLSLTQSKYWSYKSGYLVGSGNGVGVWNQTNNINLQQGQISVHTPSIQVVCSAEVFMYAVRFSLYVQMDGKTR